MRSQPGRLTSFRHWKTSAVCRCSMPAYRSSSFSRTITTSIFGCSVGTHGAWAVQGRTLAKSPRVLRSVTLRLLKPPPDGVVIGAFSITRVLRNTSQLSGAMPALWPIRYTASPIAMRCGAIDAPAAASTRSVASMISGPMPSPQATATGTGPAPGTEASCDCRAWRSGRASRFMLVFRSRSGGLECRQPARYWKILCLHPTHREKAMNKDRTRRLSRITPQQLRAFEVTARLLSVTSAARELHLTQPTVSVQLRELAAAVGEPLFASAGRGIRLTQAGEALQQTAGEVADCW